MNKLPLSKRVAVVSALVQGNSLRSTCRMTGVAMNTILKLLAVLGPACAQYQDETLRRLTCRRIQCDEVWQFATRRRRTSRLRSAASSATATCGRGSRSTPIRTGS